MRSPAVETAGGLSERTLEVSFKSGIAAGFLNTRKQCCATENTVRVDGGMREEMGCLGDGH